MIDPVIAKVGPGLFAAKLFSKEYSSVGVGSVCEAAHTANAASKIEGIEKRIPALS